MWKILEMKKICARACVRACVRDVHSTDETIVWRDPGDIEPVYDY